MTLKARWAWMLIAPALLLILVFFLLPIGAILLRSITEPKFGFATYSEDAGRPDDAARAQSHAAHRTGAVAICLVLGYPYAYLMTLVGPSARILMLALVTRAVLDQSDGAHLCADLTAAA